MGVYFSLLNSIWSDDNQFMMFIKKMSRDGSSSSRYTGFIKNWLTTLCDHIDNFILSNHMNAYSNIKGGDTYASLGPTDPPPLS